MDEKVYTVSAAAKALGFSRQTVLVWIKTGKIAAYKVLRDYRIQESEIRRIRGDKS